MNSLPNTVIFKHVSNRMSPRDWSSVSLILWFMLTVIWPWSWQKLETLSNNVLHLFNVPICHPRFAQFKMSVKIYDKDYVILRKLFIIPLRSCSLTSITGQIQYNQRINFGDLPITPTLIGRLPMFCLKNLFLRLSELREIICRIKTKWYVKL